LLLAKAVGINEYENITANVVYALPNQQGFAALSSLTLVMKGQSFFQCPHPDCGSSSFGVRRDIIGSKFNLPQFLTLFKVACPRQAGG